MKETFKTVGVYQYSYEAQIVKGRIESEGIEVFLFDDLTIEVDPLMSNSIGGVKLKVLSNQEEEAISIINSIEKYSIDDKGERVTCPKCKKDKIQLYTTVKGVKSFFPFLLSLLVAVLPFYVNYKYRCENCKTEFN